jgi:opine dehydrogenase
VAVLGAGNGGCAAAADLTRRGFAVRLYSRSEARLRPLREREGIAYTGVLGDGFAPISCITNDVGDAVRGADLVMIVAPMMAHATLAAAAAPHLSPDQVLMAAPGHTALHVPSVLRAHGIPRPVTCETTTLPYACRLVGPATVRIALEVRRLVFAAFPARRTEALAARVAQVYPAVAPARNVLETVFLYMNAIHHPPATLCNAGRIEWGRGEYCHYYEGITPSVGRLIDRLDAERQAVAAALGVRTEPFVEYFFRMGYTTAAANETGLAYEAFHQSEPDRWIKAPPSLEHRYLDEDVPYGLVPLAHLGRLAGVPTPTMDALIHLASVVKGIDYMREGLTLERLGIAGVPRAELDRLLVDGFEP